MLLPLKSHTNTVSCAGSNPPTVTINDDSMCCQPIHAKNDIKIQYVCNTPKYTLAVFDMFRVFCKRNLNVSSVKCETWKFRYPEIVQDLRTILSFVKRGHKSYS